MNKSAQGDAYYGYTVKQNAETGRWSVYWKDKLIDEDFASQAEAEEWIDEQIPLNR